VAKAQTATASNKASGKKRSKGTGTPRKPKAKAAKNKRSLAWKLARLLLLLGIALTLLGASGVVGIFWFYSRDLPPIFSAADYNPKQVTRIYDRDGNVLIELFDERRTVISIDEIPEVMRYSMIAAEDAGFYEHKGLDYWGVLRAAYTNIQRGGFSQGASTITQQVVKNLLLTPEREVKRKVQEVLLARRLEEVLSKDEILWLYLNQVYWGHRNYGIEEASRFYFDKSTSELDLNEASTLAGMVQSPERLSPFKHPERCLERRNYVLNQMRAKGFITEAAYASTLEQPITPRTERPTTLGMASHFVEAIRRQLLEEYGRDIVYTGGLEVHTTVDLTVQVEAEAAVRQGLREFDQRHGDYQVFEPGKLKPDDNVGKMVAERPYVAVVTHVTKDSVELRVGDHVAPLELVPRSRIIPSDKDLPQVFQEGKLFRVVLGKGSGMKPESFLPAPGADAALLCMAPDSREVLAMVGGYDYSLSSFNRATQARRQTGSSFKPIVFSAALEKKVITPSTRIDDAPKVFHIPGKDEPWSPRNFDGKFKGPMLVRTALALSRNTVAVDVLERVGIDSVLEYAKRIGVTSPLVENFTMALGSTEMTVLEMVNTFSTFASGGFLADPIFVTRVEKRGGEVLFAAEHAPTRVISAEVAYLTTSLLSSVVTEGTARKALLGWEHSAAGKTGTTNGPRDAWFLGYTDYLVAGVYVGFDAPQDLGGHEGGSKTALPIWANFMKAVHRDRPPRQFTVPSGLIQASIDPQSGKLAGPHTPKPREEWFLPGTVPKETAFAPGEVDPGDWTMREIGRGRPLPADPDPVDGAGDVAAPDAKLAPKGAHSDDRPQSATPIDDDGF